MWYNSHRQQKRQRRDKGPGLLQYSIPLYFGHHHDRLNARNDFDFIFFPVRFKPVQLKFSKIIYYAIANLGFTSSKQTNFYHVSLTE